MQKTTNKSLVVIKPHAVERGLVGTFLTRFENMGFRIDQIKKIESDHDLWNMFYPSDKSWLASVGRKTIESYHAMHWDYKEKIGFSDPVKIGKIIKSWLVDHMSSGASLAVILEGNQALEKVRAVCGSTLPNKAQPGTIRFDFSNDSPILANQQQRPVFNLIHASDPNEKRDGLDAFTYEAGILFPELKTSL